MLPTSSSLQQNRRVIHGRRRRKARLYDPVQLFILIIIAVVIIGSIFLASTFPSSTLEEVNYKKQDFDKPQKNDESLDKNVIEVEKTQNEIEIEAAIEKTLIHAAEEKKEDTKGSIAIEEDQEPESLFPLEYLGSSSLVEKDNFSRKGGMYSEWKDGRTPYKITRKLKLASDEIAYERREKVKAAMIHAWDGYKNHAFGHDEVKPVSGGFTSHWGGLGVTLVDALDTLWLMGLKEDFWVARDWVRDNLNHDIDKDVSVFETTIRSLGGLLSAYSWSRDVSFLNKAKDIGERLFKAFSTNPNDGDRGGIPYGQVNLKTGLGSGQGWLGSKVILSEIGSLQIEFRELAAVTGKKDYAQKSEYVFEALKGIQPSDGLFQSMYSIDNGHIRGASSDTSFGAFGDSFFEYELKIWLQGGRTEGMYRDMYDKSIDGMHSRLLTRNSDGLWYIGNKSQRNHFDHLTCFMGGLLALGAYTDPNGLDSVRAERDLETGKKLAYTCYQMYAYMPTGLAPDEIVMRDSLRGSVPFQVTKSDYILRPETVETFFILNKLTGDPIYRTWGWEIFEAIERFCKTDIAYGAYSDVSNTDSSPTDSMESFFMGETLKYLYLLFDPDTEIDILNEHVFNTEAHPLKIFKSR